MEMLELNNLHKTFNPGTVNEKVALNGVSLHMEAGDFATIVGSNGAGKSTMFNAITGGFIADEGSIVLGGQDITFAPEYERSKVIGHLFQDPLKGTAPNMTIEENLALAYLRAGTAPHAIFSRISSRATTRHSGATTFRGASHGAWCCCSASGWSTRRSTTATY